MWCLPPPASGLQVLKNAEDATGGRKGYTVLAEGLSEGVGMSKQEFGMDLNSAAELKPHPSLQWQCAATVLRQCHFAKRFRSVFSTAVCVNRPGRSDTGAQRPRSLCANPSHKSSCCSAWRCGYLLSCCWALHPVEGRSSWRGTSSLQRGAASSTGCAAAAGTAFTLTLRSSNRSC